MTHFDEGWLPGMESFVKDMSGDGGLFAQTFATERVQRNFARAVRLGLLTARSAQASAIDNIDSGSDDAVAVAAAAVSTRLILTVDAFHRASEAGVKIAQLAPQVRDVVELAVVIRGTHLSKRGGSGASELATRLRDENNALMLDLIEMASRSLDVPPLATLMATAPWMSEYVKFEIEDRSRQKSEAPYKGLIEWERYYKIVQLEEPTLLSDESPLLWRFANKLVHFSSIGVISPVIDAALQRNTQSGEYASGEQLLRHLGSLLEQIISGALRGMLLDGMAITLETLWLMLGAC
ncbi:MAG: hypothetical protein M0Z91_04555 [Actinomycetota bacterium]|nr:hypothetical protein [Actinomycetota bacterium]